jgi:hypothetical protein
VCIVDVVVIDDEREMVVARKQTCLQVFQSRNHLVRNETSWDQPCLRVGNKRDLMPFYSTKIKGPNLGKNTLSNGQIIENSPKMTKTSQNRHSMGAPQPHHPALHQAR